MRRIILEKTYGKLTALYRQEEEDGTVELILVPKGTAGRVVREDCNPEPLIQVKLEQDDQPASFAGGRSMRCSDSMRAMVFAGQETEETEDSFCIVTDFADPRGLRYRHSLRLFPDSAAAETEVSVCNEGDHPVWVEMLSSFALGSLSPFSSGLAPETLFIHRMRSSWSAEGRLITERAEDLQLEPSWSTNSFRNVRFGTRGSMPVREYIPFCAVEDRQNQVTWAAVTTHGMSWQIELYRHDNGLSMSGGLADFEFGHWKKKLDPGERFTAPRGVLCAVKGGVDDAAQEITESMRKTVEKNMPESEKDMPVLFNEYCSTWGHPSEESILSQLPRLKNKGIDCYVIDDGWQKRCPETDSSCVGEWELNRKLFPHGMKYVVDRIHEAGMKAGIWFEVENVGPDAGEYYEKTEWLVKLNGLPVSTGYRRFWDMRNPEVQAYLEKRVIGFLRENGFDYLKIDYNDSIGVGCDSQDGAYPGEGLRTQIEATQEFFRKICREVPGLILEICASGGHRLCRSFAEIGAMESFSDAHECDEIPIIAANMHRIILPRQSQIWAVIRKEHPEKTVYYKLCSGMLGRLCLSGDIERIQPEQMEIVSRAVAFYRKAAPVIDRGKSERYGTEIISYRHPRGWQAVCRKSDRQILVVVHTFHDGPEKISVPAGIGSQWETAVFAREGINVDVEDGCLIFSGLTDFDGAAVLVSRTE